MFSLGCFSQAKYVEVYIDNGEFIKGELVAIGNDILLIKSGERIESVERKNVSLVLPAETKRTSTPRASGSSTGSYRNARPSSYSQYSISSATRQPRARYNLLDNKWMSEVGGGLYPFTPFAIDFSFTQWKRIGKTWAVGAGISWDFSTYSMAKFSLHGRKFLKSEGVVKPFINATGGWSPTAGFFGPFQFGWGWLDISNIQQGTGGLGVLLDSGSRIGFVGQFGFAATFYSTEELTWDNRQIIASYQHYGPYLLMSLIF